MQRTPRTSGRERRAPMRYTPSAETTRRVKNNVATGQEDLENVEQDLNTKVEASSPTNPSFFGRILSKMTPFGGEKAPSSMSSKSSRKSQLGAEYEDMKSEIKTTIFNLEQELELQKVEIEDAKIVLDELKEKSVPTHPRHVPEHLREMLEEIDKLEIDLRTKKSNLRKSEIKTNTKIKGLNLQLESLDNHKLADLEEIDEENDQYLGSDEDNDQESLTGADRVVNWADEVENQKEPSDPPPTLMSMDTFVQALKSAFTPSQSATNITEKMLIRQSIGRDLPIFSGKATEWPTFIATYKRTTEACGFTDAENIERIRKCLRGEAAKSVECLLVSPDSLPKVLQLLEDRYGRAEDIVHSMIQNMKAVPTVKDEKPETLVTYGTAVINLIATIKNLEQDEHLHNPILLRELEDKLPMTLRMLWDTHAVTLGRKHTMDDFVAWIELRTKMAHRLVSQKVVTQARSHHDERREDHSKKNQSGDFPTAAGLHAGATKGCVFCSKTNHQGHECFKAEKMPWKEKSGILSKARACFKCFNTDGHKSKDCKWKTVCVLCQGPHHKPMCPLLPSNVKEQSASTRTEDSPPDSTSAATANIVCRKDVLMKTVLVRVVGPKGSRVIRLVFDDGSQLSNVTEDLIKAVGSPSVGHEWARNVLFGATQTEARKIEIHEVELQSLDGKFKRKLCLRKCPKICGELPRIPSGPWINELRKKKIFLSDWESAHVDKIDIEVLIGSDYWGQLVTGKPIKSANGLVVVDTVFGWTLSGVVPGADMPSSGMMSISTSMLTMDIQDLWSLETLGITDPTEHKTKQEKEQEAREHFLKTVSRNEDGRYSVTLPWIDGCPSIPNNFQVAEKRLISATAKLKAAGKFQVYDDIFKSWEEENFIEEVPADSKQNVYHLPHRPVFKPESITTPVRPVFDASCKTGRSPSLNDCLWKGPNLLELIPSLILRFREKEIGVISDLRKAFQMVEVAEKDRDHLRFLWWENGQEKQIKIYRHRRVVFGVNCSPSHLGAVIEYHLSGMDEERKEIAMQLLRSLYVDNCVTSVNSMIEYEEFKEKTTLMMSEATMELRQWEHSAGESTEVGCLAKKECGLVLAGECSPQALTSVLGLKWNKESDAVYVEIPKDSIPSNISKRIILSRVQQIFDPMGFLAPATLVPKLLLQKTWNLKKGWDEDLQDEVKSEFEEWWRESGDLEQICIPRHAFGDTTTQNIQFHIFSDASSYAYAAAVFVRVEDDQGVSVHLLQAKARVSPVKKVTIPRLELLGCVIAARLGTSVKQAYSMEDKETYFHCDATTALAWIKNNDEWGTFVGNRVKEICTLTKAEDWRHVPGVMNPADLPSRGCNPAELLRSRWWEGPAWLRKPKSEWPNSEGEVDEELVRSEMKTKVAVSLFTAQSPQPWYTESFPSFSRNVRVVAFMLRFANNSRKSEKDSGRLNQTEIDQAEKKVLRMIQEESFLLDEDVVDGLRVDKDEDGLLRVRTKIVNISGSEDFRRPILLPKSHPVVNQLIRTAHFEHKHAGLQILMSVLREKFWIINLRRTVKSVIAKCVICRRFSSKKIEVPTAPLPAERVETARVFQVVGVDLAGPFYLKTSEKAWMVLYTCAVYRAIHLELVSSLTTEEFLLSLHRFVSRRGRPTTMYSDNGLNFEGANNAFNLLNWEEIQSQSQVHRIQWKFNVPASPWWGGFWERLIRNCKDLLKSMLGNKKLNMAQLETLMFEVEAVVNSRPLTYISEAVDDLVPLTPAMFLQDVREVDFPEEKALDAQALRNRHQELTVMRQELKSRFQKEYLSLLVQRGKEKKAIQLRVGDVVLVECDDKKRVLWPMARITELITGKDGNVRVAKLKTKNGVLTRPLQRLFPLEVSTEEVPPVMNTVKISNQPWIEETSTAEREFRTRFGRKVQAPRRLGFKV